MTSEVVIPDSILSLLDPNVVRFSPKLQGSRSIDGEGIELGLKAGPSRSLSNGLHELAHFIEIDDARSFVSGWGLEGGKVDMGMGYTAYGTDKHVRREMRCWAIEYYLRDLAGIPASVEHITRACTFLPDIEFVIPPLDCEYRERDLKIREYVALETQKLIEGLTLEEILKELDRKQKLSPRYGRGLDLG